MNAFLSFLERLLIGVFVVIFGGLAIMIGAKYYSRAAEDQDPWLRARKVATIEAYLDFLRQCGSCPQEGKAEKVLEELQRARGLIAKLASSHLDERAGISLASFSPQGRVILASGGHGPGFWDAETGQHLARGPKDFALRGRRLATLDFSPDGRRIAAGTGGIDNGSLVVWDEASGQTIAEQVVEGFAVNAVEFSPDSKIVAWLAGGPVGVWEPTGGQFLRSFHEGATDLAFFRDENQKTLLLTAAGRELWFWDPASMELIRQRRIDTDRPLLGLSRDGRHAVYSDGTVLEVWSSRSTEQLGSLRDLDGTITAFCQEPRKGRLIVGTQTGLLYVWDPAGSPLPLARVAAHEGPVEQVACSEQGRMVSISWDAARIWNLERLIRTQGEPTPR